jgi:hypothetical protein
MQNQEFFNKEQVGELVDWLLSKVEKHFGELPKDLSDVYVGKIVDDWASEKNIVPTTFSVEDAIETLQKEGFCIPNKEYLWHVEEIMERLNCDDVDASWFGTEALCDDNVCEKIWDTIYRMKEEQDED